MVQQRKTGGDEGEEMYEAMVRLRQGKTKVVMVDMRPKIKEFGLGNLDGVSTHFLAVPVSTRKGSRSVMTLTAEQDMLTVTAEAVSGATFPLDAVVVDCTDDQIGDPPPEAKAELLHETVLARCDCGKSLCKGWNAGYVSNIYLDADGWKARVGVTKFLGTTAWITYSTADIVAIPNPPEFS